MVDESLQRGIAPQFIEALTHGILLPILDRLRHDDTLSLEIRNGYVDIYYRGGRLLGSTRNGGRGRSAPSSTGSTATSTPTTAPALPQRPPRSIAREDDARAWVDALAPTSRPWTSASPSTPRSSASTSRRSLRDNNRHARGERTDYMIVDIEYAQSPRAFPGRSRLPLRHGRPSLAGRGRQQPRAGPSRRCIIEMKAGDAALASHPVAGDPGKTLSRASPSTCATSRPSSRLSRARRSRPATSCCAPNSATMFETKKRLGLPSSPEEHAGARDHRA